MNWLAHVFLSKPNLDFQLGNLLTDRLTLSELQGHTPDFQAGVKCHRAIDKFTDSHPVVTKSKARLFPKYRHFSSVLIDVYYDYILVKNWEQYTNTPYRAYVDQFYKNLESHNLDLSPKGQTLLENIVLYDILGRYDKIEAVTKALERISMRLKKKKYLDFTDGASSLMEHYEAFEEEFLQFFPELQKHVVEEFHENETND